MTNLETTTKSTVVDGHGEPKKKKRQALLFGDSHAHAVQRAIAKREGKGQPVSLAAHRLLKEKNGVRIGTTSFEAFLKLIGNLRPKDLVVSMIGGNQHAVYSTIQQPQRFDFFSPDVDARDKNPSELIPYRALEDVFDHGLRTGDGRSLGALRAATVARIVHVLPPPPKQDNEHILRHHESSFAKDLPQFGVSAPELRLKFWKLQRRVLVQICSELKIEVMNPPKRVVDHRGFLRPEFYANDATHGNWLYGEHVMREVERLYLGSSVEGAHIK
jgi:hypothetical protein